MEPEIRATFDRGTLVVQSPEGVAIGGTLWDARTDTFRAPAHRLHHIVNEARWRGLDVGGDPRPLWRRERFDGKERSLSLRSYQAQALAAWNTFERRGVICLPTGAGKTRVAIAAILESRVPAVVLCPTCALAAAWVAELERWFAAPIGLFADGERRLTDITVMTFESAYRHMDRLGDRFGLLVVDEAHHFSAQGRAEALESCAATSRMGLSATPPTDGSVGRSRLEWLIGPVVFEIGFEALVGTHLAELSVVRRSVRLDPVERDTYVRGSEPFLALRRDFMLENPGADFVTVARALSASREGRRALRAHAAALELASFPAAKRALVSELLALHKVDKCVVFTAFVENAYAVALDNLIPVIAAATGAKERAAVLEAFREGRLRAVASARVLNEGIDIPDANVAIIVAGSLGRREHIQRIGRVLRKADGKIARVYELVTHETADERRAEARGPLC